MSAMTMLAPCKLEQNSKIPGHPIIKQETIEPSPPLVPKGLKVELFKSGYFLSGNFNLFHTD